jgi:hypothetical protein
LNEKSEHHSANGISMEDLAKALSACKELGPKLDWIIYKVDENFRSALSSHMRFFYLHSRILEIQCISLYFASITLTVETSDLCLLSQVGK